MSWNHILILLRILFLFTFMLNKHQHLIFSESCNSSYRHEILSRTKLYRQKIGFARERGKCFEEEKHPSKTWRSVLIFLHKIERKRGRFVFPSLFLHSFCFLNLPSAPNTYLSFCKVSFHWLELRYAFNHTTRNTIDFVTLIWVFCIH